MRIFQGKKPYFKLIIPGLLLPISLIFISILFPTYPSGSEYRQIDIVSIMEIELPDKSTQKFEIPYQCIESYISNSKLGAWFVSIGRMDVGGNASQHEHSIICQPTLASVISFNGSELLFPTPHLGIEDVRLPTKCLDNPPRSNGPNSISLYSGDFFCNDFNNQGVKDQYSINEDTKWSDNINFVINRKTIFSPFALPYSRGVGMFNSITQFIPNVSHKVQKNVFYIFLAGSNDYGNMDKSYFVKNDKDVIFTVHSPRIMLKNIKKIDISEVETLNKTPWPF